MNANSPAIIGSKDRCQPGLRTNSQANNAESTTKTDTPVPPVKRKKAKPNMAKKTAAAIQRAVVDSLLAEDESQLPTAEELGAALAAGVAIGVF